MLANSVDADQLGSEEANWSGSALFAIQNVTLYQQSELSNLIGWKLEMGMAIYSAGQGLTIFVKGPDCPFWDLNAIAMGIFIQKLRGRIQI